MNRRIVFPHRDSLCEVTHFDRFILAVEVMNRGAATVILGKVNSSSADSSGSSVRSSPEAYVSVWFFVVLMTTVIKRKEMRNR